MDVLRILFTIYLQARSPVIESAPSGRSAIIISRLRVSGRLSTNLPPNEPYQFSQPVCLSLSSTAMTGFLNCHCYSSSRRQRSRRQITSSRIQPDVVKHSPYSAPQSVFLVPGGCGGIHLLPPEPRPKQQDQTRSTPAELHDHEGSLVNLQFQSPRPKSPRPTTTPTPDHLGTFSGLNCTLR